MKDAKKVVAVDQAVTVPEEVVPSSRFVEYYRGEGYGFAPFLTRNREEAKAEADRLRKDESKLSAYAPLLKGFFGVFVKDAPAREARAAKAEPKKVVTFSTEGFTGTTKEARAFARRLMDEARNAEFEADLQEAVALKA